MPGPQIESLSREQRRFPPPAEFTARAHLRTRAEYDALYRRSLDDPDGFWAEMAERFLVFERRWDRVFEWEPASARCRWFAGARLNASVNCLDRHLETPRRHKAALIWQGEEQDERRTLTYAQLHREVCRFSNVLRDAGVKKGDRVCIYLPMIPEIAVAVLSCARLGAPHNVVFGGFSAEALADRITDSGCAVLITADEGRRAGKPVPLKAAADQALARCPSVRRVFVVRRTGGPVAWDEARDRWWHEAMAAPGITDRAPPESMDAEDPLFLLYTSGTTGKPKGVLHTTAGYLLHVALTTHYVFDLRDEDLFWCTADLGWVTGHSYVLYGPLALGATTLMFEGVPNWPAPDRCWQIAEELGVTVFYTAPTALRALMREGDDWVRRRDRSRLRLLGTVGEPINPEAWMWYHDVVGEGRCPIVDTWWQTETGGILITPLPGAIETKPGSATVPFFGVDPVILDDQGRAVAGTGGGMLCLRRPWPGMMRTVYGDHQRFLDTYWTRFPGQYFTGDGARRDEDGYFWLMGRVDDVINISGHRLGTAEVESALVAHPDVAEAAVVPIDHPIKGQALYAFVTPNAGVDGGPAFVQVLFEQVVKEIGKLARPEVIQVAPALPKTRSGKIMRRVLRQIAAGSDDLGDTTTLADPSVVAQLLAGRRVRGE